MVPWLGGGFLGGRGKNSIRIHVFIARKKIDFSGIINLRLFSLLGSNVRVEGKPDQTDCIREAAYSIVPAQYSRFDAINGAGKLAHLHSLRPDNWVTSKTGGHWTLELAQARSTESSWHANSHSRSFEKARCAPRLWVNTESLEESIGLELSNHVARAGPPGTHPANQKSVIEPWMCTRLAMHNHQTGATVPRTSECNSIWASYNAL